MVTVCARVLAINGQHSDYQHSAATEKCMHHGSGLSSDLDSESKF